MKRVALTKEIFIKSKTYSNKHPKGIKLYQEMNECHLDGWSLDMYISYLAQYFIYESIAEIVEPIWNKCALLKEYDDITKYITTLKVGSKDWLSAISHQSDIAKDLVLLTSNK
ncbi:hypothetical protein [Vibrio phage BUCT194]|uniref:Uncharacterized protein n=1 Tax=Vibrio phage BUCT194 TaxID=2859072 RepID=A0AAE8XF64_9CAUD|nr:hypothetical protein PP741_gp038 [Vibrio phage BUCT194]UAW01187.1 hypothetical protein [Vibrio phage BUCT194]